MEPNLQIFKEIAETLGKLPSREEFTTAFREVLKFVQSLSDSLNRKIDERLAQIKDGKNGIQGPKGDKGDKGDRGPMGRTFIAMRGLQGEQGVPGRDGSSDTPQQVRDKLESIQVEEEKLSISAIANLKEELDSLKKSAKSSGMASGGVTAFGSIVHSPKHEVFTMNGSDTTVTLSDGVTADGHAAFVRLQGQMLDDGVHYTINGNKISFTFTPDNGATISCTYWP